MWSCRTCIVWPESVECMGITRPNSKKVSAAVQDSAKPSGWVERSNLIYLPRISWPISWEIYPWVVFLALGGSGRQDSFSIQFWSLMMTGAVYGCRPNLGWCLNFYRLSSPGFRKWSVAYLLALGCRTVWWHLVWWYLVDKHSLLFGYVSPLSA